MKNNRSFAKVRRPAAVTCHEVGKNISKIFFLNPKVLQKAAVKEKRSVKALLFCRCNWFSSEVSWCERRIFSGFSSGFGSGI
ncbi:MAG TPA: hypothetical protein VL528_02610 [Oxalicibacterium sp.]|jgi:hypothetical protein|nr:hypothetical protein [Oxalicibacterium sp.]